MLHANTTLLGYRIVPQLAVHFTGCGAMSLKTPVSQAKRAKPCFVLYLVLKGELRLCDELSHGAEIYRVRPNELHLVPPEMSQYSTEPCEPGTQLLWLHFSFFGDPSMREIRDLSDAERCLNDPNAPACWLLPRHLEIPGTSNLDRLHAELRDYSRLHGRSDMGGHQICGHLIATLHSLFRDRLLQTIGRQRTPAAWAHAARACHYLRQHYDKSVSLTEIAKAVSVTPAYLSRTFRDATGQTVVDYLQRLRVDAAKELLASGTRPSIKEVAFLAGFSSSAYFCRVFKALERKTPMQFVVELDAVRNRSSAK